MRVLSLIITANDWSTWWYWMCSNSSPKLQIEQMTFVERNCLKSILWSCYYYSPSATWRRILATVQFEWLNFRLNTQIFTGLTKLFRNTWKVSNKKAQLFSVLCCVRAINVCLSNNAYYFQTYVYLRWIFIALIRFQSEWYKKLNATSKGKIKQYMFLKPIDSSSFNLSGKINI